MEIIPAIDIRKGRSVRLAQGRLEEEVVYSRDPLAMAMRWEREGAGRLHVVDIDGAFSGKPVNKKLIAGIARKVSVPVQVGGGIRSLKDIKYYLYNGADKVILGTKILQEKRFLRAAGKRFPGRILVALDVKNGKAALRGWKKLGSVSALSLAEEIDNIGIGIIYTDISRDGMLKGPNLKFMLRLIKGLNNPVIVSGGIGCLSDIQKIKRLSPDMIRGVVIGQALYSREITLRDALAYA